MSTEQTFGRLEGRAYLKYNGKFYAITAVETTSNIDGRQQQVITCAEIGSAKRAKQTKLALEGEGLIDPFVGAFEAQQETGYPQFLLIDLETGEWRAYPITEELKRQFPFLRDRLDYIA